MSQHRDLIVWQRSMELVHVVYERTRSWPKTEVVGLTSQVRRAAVSIPSNIAEGHGRRSDAELVRFLRIANGSLRELETQWEIAYGQGFVNDESWDAVSSLVNEIGRLIQSLIRRLDQPKITSRPPTTNRRRKPLKTED
jgi:four helix bundle protein